VKDYRSLNAAGQGGKWFLVLTLIIVAALRAPAQTPTDADAAMRRVARARALAASHNLAAAAAELDAIITSTTDDAMRDVARIMLMNIYLEEANYTKADALLVATFEARSTGKESNIRSYFALAGQTINGARTHLDRYRSFGINVADSGLPPEAVNDLDRLRLILERVVEQAKEIIGQDAKRSDAAALLEEAAGVRGALARNDLERQQWQKEIASARESLAASETRIASLGRPQIPARATATPGNPAGSGSPRASAPPPAASTPATQSGTASGASQRPAAPSAAAQSDAHGTTTTGATGTTQPSRAPGAGGGQPPQPINVGSLVDKATQRVSPSYPAIAKSAHVTGVVTVFLELDEKGSVAVVHRTDGPQMLRQAAVDAARKWKFKPTLVDGQPVRVIGYINFSFTQ
jgi:protein TonB